MTNPFIGYGRVIQGARLVGRSSEFQSIKERLDGFTGSLSVVGEHRIGKTSLVKSALTATISARENGNIAYAWITLSTIPDLWQFYVTLLNEIDLSVCANATTNLARELPREATNGKSLYEAFRVVRTQLKGLAKQGIRTICVIDEFDAVRTFEGAEVFIQQLRELADFQDETGFLALFISRRSLYHLEKQLGNISNLDGICEKMYLRPLSHSAFTEMIDRCGDEWTPSSDDRCLLYKQTGGHPFLTEMILCHAWSNKSMSEGISSTLSEMYGHYERLAAFLEEDGVLCPLIQLTVGPRYNVSQENLERLAKYGIIRRQINLVPVRWVGWSEHFQAFLEKRAREVPLWQEWTLSESLLRDIIREVYKQKYGNDWMLTLAKSHAQAANVIAECEDRRKRESCLFGEASLSCLLEYSYPIDLWMLMTREWGLFLPILRKDKGYWQARFEFLSRVRAPLSHSRECYVPQSVVQTALGYCREISDLLGHVRSKDLVPQTPLAKKIKE